MKHFHLILYVVALITAFFSSTAIYRITEVEAATPPGADTNKDFCVDLAAFAATWLNCNTPGCDPL